MEDARGRTFLMVLMVSFRDTGNLRKIPVGSRKSIMIPWSPSFSHSSCIPYFPGGMMTASHLPSAPLLLTGTRAGASTQRKTEPGVNMSTINMCRCALYVRSELLLFVFVPITQDDPSSQGCSVQSDKTCRVCMT